MSNYPSDLDNDATLPSVIDGATEIDGAVINALKSAVLAIQAAIGSDPQGTLGDLVSRLAVAINDDGTLKTSALFAASLLSITDANVSASAGIQESKLALDVATQLLQNQIISNDIDIGVLQIDLAQLIGDFSSHHTGTALRHDSAQILLDNAFPVTTPPWLTGVTAVNVRQALEGIANLLAQHTGALEIGAHRASNISVDAVFEFITATDVQGALEQLESQRSAELDVHRDESHSNGISMWENDPLGWNRNGPLYPVSGSATTATALSRYVVDFNVTGPVLLKADFRVRRGDALVIGGEAYSVADVGPRPGVGSRPTLNESQVEVLRPLPVGSGSLQAAVFGRSSVSNLKVALASTVLPGTATADSLLLARPNAAKVVSIGFSPLFIDGSAELAIEIGTAPATTRTITVTDLHLNRDGTGPAAPLSIYSVVERINYVLSSAAEGNFAPAAAYVIGSEVAIAHNWSNSADYSIAVTGPTAAAIRGSALCGFGEPGSGSINVTNYPTITGKYWVSGQALADFADYYSGTGSVSGSTIAIPVNTAEAGILPGHVLHLITAGANSEVGSYQITAVGANTVQVNATLTAASSVEVRIDASSVSLANLDGAVDPVLVQVFVDSNGFTEASLRASFQEGIAGLSLVDVSDAKIAGLESIASTAVSPGVVALQFSTASAENAKTLRSGIAGKIRVFDSTGISWADFALNGSVGTGTSSGQFYDHADEEDTLELAVIRFFDRKIGAISDKRLFGSLGLDELREDVVQAYVESPLAELRSSGVVRGFSVLDEVPASTISTHYPAGTQMVLVDGGVAYVDGVRVVQAPYYVPVPLADGVYFLCIGVSGTISVISETNFSLAEILEGLAGSLVPLVQATMASGTLDSIPIAYNIANIDERVDAVLDLTNNFIGNFSRLDAAIAYLNAYPFEERARLRIVSRRAASTADDLLISGLVVPVTFDIDGYVRDIAVESDVTISSDTLLSRAQPHASALTVNTSKFFAKGLILKDVTINLASISDGEYVFQGCEFAVDASITVIGSSGLGRLVFDGCTSRGGSFAISCATTDGEIAVSNSSFRATPGSTGSPHAGNISLSAAKATVNDVQLTGTGFQWNSAVAPEFSLFVNNLTMSDVLVTSTVAGFASRTAAAMINGLTVKNSYREGGTIVDLGTAVTSRVAGLLVDVCNVQFTVGVPSIFVAGGESYLDGAVISGLTLPAPVSEDVHIRVPNLSGFLYDGSEIISVDADEIFGSVGIGTTSGAGADGIGSQSAAGSLLASKTGAAGIDIAPLASGSSYILGGSTVFGPLTPGSLSLAGDPLFADRGLIQVYINPQGQSEAAYRVQKFPDGTDPLNLGFAQIVDVSDSHVTTLAGFDLVFDGTNLSWADGEPVVPVVGETQRLFCSDYSGWLDVKTASAPGAAGQDKYKVLASKKNAGGLLLGHAFWDGAAISPVADKRYFGNIAGSDFTDNTKADLRADVVELRSNMVYSGGAVTFGLPGIAVGEVRVSGPLVAYVAGRRFEVPLAFGTDNVINRKGGYSGLAMPFAAPVANFLYVDSSGAFQIASSWPAGDHARIAEVTVAAGVVSAMVDNRSATVGLTSADSLEWEAGTKTLSILSSGSTTGTTLLAETLEATTLNTSEVISSTGPLLVKSNSGDLTVQSISGDVLVTTAGAGTLALSATGTGTATLSTVSGNISVASGTGNIGLSSGGNVSAASLTGGMSLFVGGAAPVPAAGDVLLGNALGSGGISIFAGGAPPTPSTNDLRLGAADDIQIVANGGSGIESSISLEGNASIPLSIGLGTGSTPSKTVNIATGLGGPRQVSLAGVHRVFDDPTASPRISQLVSPASTKIVTSDISEAFGSEADIFSFGVKAGYHRVSFAIFYRTDTSQNIRFELTKAGGSGLNGRLGYVTGTSGTRVVSDQPSYTASWVFASGVPTVTAPYRVLIVDGSIDFEVDGEFKLQAAILSAGTLFIGKFSTMEIVASGDTL